MKTKTETVGQQDDGVLEIANPLAGCNSKSFARQLRALGQALERFRFSAFDVKIEDGSYLVVVKAIPISRHPNVTSIESQIDLRFSQEEIERFDWHGKKSRQDSSKMPDPYSVSQILRGAGFYLDHRSVANLMEISLKEKCMMVRYETREGRLEHTEHDFEYFYDCWINIYLRHSRRPNHFIEHCGLESEDFHKPSTDRNADRLALL